MSEPEFCFEMFVLADIELLPQQNSYPNNSTYKTILNIFASYLISISVTVFVESLPQNSSFLTLQDI